MSDIACIYNMNMVEENEQLEDDLLAGRGMDILFCLMDQLKTRKEIARRLGMPVYSVQLYLQRLVNAGLVKEERSCEDIIITTVKKAEELMGVSTNE